MPCVVETLVKSETAWNAVTFLSGYILGGTVEVDN